MTYLESVRLLHSIESSYDVFSIKYRGIPIWPYLRIKLFEKASGAGVTYKPSTKTGVFLVLSTLFYYNPFNLLKKSSIWLFSAFERRKMIGDHAVMRVSGGVVAAYPKTLVIEKPSSSQPKTARKAVPEKRIVSESWILFFAHLFAVLLKPFRYNIDGKEILNNVIKENKLDFDYQSAIRLLLAQKKTIDILLRITHKPKRILVECPYTIMGYIWSMHEHGVNVTELQHGVLNEKHYAYNSLFHSKEFYPDQICVFGDVEYDFFMSENSHYCKNVVRTGLYFLEISDQSFTTDVFITYRKRYKLILLVSGQLGYEKRLSDFINTVAAISKDILFVYVPRTQDETLVFSEQNILYSPGVNIYEYMKWCDAHLTISSTTCLECQYFKKPTLFYDYVGLASNYYKSVLSVENGVYYLNDADDFQDALSFIDSHKGEFKFRDIFAHGSVKKIKELLFE